MEIRYINNLNKEIKISSKPSTLRLYNLEGREGLRNTINISKTTYIDGVNVNSMTVGERSLTIVGKIISRNDLEIDQLKRNLIKTFTVKGNGTLYFKSNDEAKEYKIEVVVSNAPSFKYSFGVIDFQIELMAYNPYFTDTNNSIYRLANIVPSFYFPLVIPTIKGYKEPSLIANIENLGDVSTGLIIEFIAKGTIVNPSLFDVITGKELKINKNMQVGETIRVNTNKGSKSVVSILNNAETKILHLLDFSSAFLELQVGDNVFRYNADSGVENLECNIYYSQKYLGV